MPLREEPLRPENRARAIAHREQFERMHGRGAETGAHGLFAPDVDPDGPLPSWLAQIVNDE